MRATNKKPDDVSPGDPGEFAAAVIKLYRHAVECNPKPLQGNISTEVRQAAFGLALIRQLLDQYAKSIHLSANIPASGIREAYGILDHLTTGKDHPIAKHIKGIHSGRFRPQHAPKNAIEQEGRKIVVAAYAEAANVSQLKARQVVIAETAKHPDFKFTESQIKKWDDRFRGREAADAFPSVGPDVWAANLSKYGDGDATKILAFGLTWIWKLWSVPWPPGNLPSSKGTAMQPTSQFLRRDAAADYLKSKYGLGAARTLAKGAVTGDTPEFQKAGRIVLYTREALDTWAISKIGKPQKSSSDGHAA